MTAPSSCKKSFFREYLFFRLNALKASFITSCVFGVMTLPLFTFAMSVTLRRMYEKTPRSETFNGYVEFFVLFCGAGLLIMSFLGAPLSFSICNRRSRTDMLGGLPVTHRERFWGDLLGGYIAHVAPVIPAGLVSVMISFGAQSWLNKLDADFPPTAACVTFIAGMALSIFVLLTFCYIVSTVVTVCCGKAVQSVMLSAVTTVVCSLLAVGTAGSLATAITGKIDNTDFVTAGMRFFPPFGALWDMYQNVEYMEGVDLSAAGGRYSKIFRSDFAAFSPLFIVYAVIFAAALIVLAYYLSRSRRQERVGSVLVHVGFSRALSVIAAAAGFMTAMSILPYLVYIDSLLLLPIAAAIGAAAAVPTAFIRKPKAKDFPRAALRFILTAACCTGIYILFDKTGAFGMRYFNFSANDVESVSVDYGYQNNTKGTISGACTITDKNDIEKLTADYNRALKTSYKDIGSPMGEYLLVTYTMNDGTTVKRTFRESRTASDAPLLSMIESVQKLDSFPEAQSAFITDRDMAVSCTAWLDDVFGPINILPSGRLDEFTDILAGEVREKYSFGAPEIGCIRISKQEGSHQEYRFIPITADYTRTADYLNALCEEKAYLNDRELVMTIQYDFYDYAFGDAGFTLTLNVIRGDLGRESVKELISLLERYSGYDYPGNRSHKYDVQLNSTPSPYRYCVPQSAEARVLELMLTLAEETAE